MFETRIPTNSASFHEPKVIVSTPKTNRIPFGIVSVLARTEVRAARTRTLRPAPRVQASPRLGLGQTAGPGSGSIDDLLTLLRTAATSLDGPGREKK
jgi:hypothetical protein